jgi:hypothetical protein
LKEQPEPTFFIDADLSGRLFNQILASAGITVERHQDHFAEGTADEVWLAEAGRRGWVVVSRNKRIRQESAQVERLMAAGTRALFLVGDAHPNPPGQKHHFVRGLAENFVRAYPSIRRFLQRHEGPWIAKVYRPADFHTAANPSPGRIKMWLTLQKWLKEL